MISNLVIVEVELAPLGHKIIWFLFKPILQREILPLKLHIEELEERINNLEVPLSKIEEQIKSLSVATKGIYELLNNVIHIASKH